MGKSWCYIWNDSAKSTEDSLEGIVDMSTYIGGGKVYVYSFQDVGIPLHNHYKYVYHNTNAMVVERDRLSGNH